MVRRTDSAFDDLSADFESFDGFFAIRDVNNRVPDSARRAPEDKHLTYYNKFTSDIIRGEYDFYR